MTSADPTTRGIPSGVSSRAATSTCRTSSPTAGRAGNPETGYLNTDGSPTKTDVLSTRNTADAHIWEACFGKRAGEELYDLAADPDCVVNLAARPEHDERKKTLREQLFRELKEQDDPRMFGKGAQFDRYPYAGKDRGYYERFKRGEIGPAPWVNPSDYAPLEAEESTGAEGQSPQ